ncbi:MULTISPECIES: efflux RND transporter periplasmic adaptor subunit [Methylomicrobium]|uniref:RND family efflux transporter, MFP subunit n=1 Tax=Methylomicrobium album BG8 TaxID=686340 RepID=H8GJ20_METAL|nr:MULTISPECIES: efflux RND transporter periplasmic adaptor subunit [Methylomicrobium]EIC31527.1 RND family efflux transporter, MFP subunit [Methylomicrobium album BG8]
MTKRKTGLFLTTLGILTGLGVFIAGRSNQPAADTVAAPRPALSVTVIRPVLRDIAMTLSANGSIAAWQEAVIGAEISDLRLTEINVQVGDKVGKGQVLAVFADESVLTDVARSRAALAEAEANLADARDNAERAKQIMASGALSGQQVNQYLTGEKTARAKVQSAKAQLDSQLLRLKYTQVLASDDGVISSRSATLGAVAARGQELFRLIRQNRLEWRGEVTAAEMAQLGIGMTASVEVPNVGGLQGKIRALAPTLDENSRNGLVYVDLPDASRHGLRAGMFARGEFDIGAKAGLIVPQTALSLRDGFSYVFRLDEQNGDLAKVSQVKVQLGQRSGDSFEILSGLAPEDRLVAGGAAFLADGDTVRVVQP